jgi:hypothetical protein
MTTMTRTITKTTMITKTTTIRREHSIVVIEVIVGFLRDAWREVLNQRR